MDFSETRVGIAGMGFYYPKTMVDTEEEAEKVNLPGKVYRNIGINKIYKPSDTDQPTRMAYESAINALDDANVSAEEIDLIIVTGFMRDYLHWQMGGWIKDKLGAKHAITMEIKGGCAAYFQAAEVAVDQIRGSSDINTVLITCGERLFGYGWPTFLSSGGQSIVIKRDCDQFNYLGFATSNFIANHKLGFIPHGGTDNPFTPETDWNDNLVENFEMDKQTYEKNIKPVVFDKFVEVTESVLKQTGYRLENLDYMTTLVQQYNFDERILDALKIPDLPTAKEYAPSLGHFNGADAYILLDKARKDGKIKKGDLILKVGLGGVAWFAALIRY
ncbi:3-oxoacyl-[acyl-carrier-protein] synthase III C-terminal domain-containing protein [Wukongibacter baidiensis]|uniref:3-oxoacyl-[acyl-carrier-protein] synthase III C-terminal domain-containing protein n=1 Tax=Wukongibacter baidiensis TaxID=1723361 RepID=UPI003D7FA90D